jgi:hypothetical protein
MADHSPNQEGIVTPSIQPDSSTDEVVSLRPLVQLIKRYRFVIVASIAGALIFGTTMLLVLAIVLPVERTGSIQFRLLFDGASNGKYPNGTSFSPAEIVATPVLADVYTANDLQRFGKYQAFKESMAVLRSSLAQDMLNAAYSARLADTKLTPVDRARLEDEFRKKREAITDPVYALTIRRNSRFRVMPPDLMEKILNDTLVGWAKQADELKGVTRFNVPVFSSTILKPELLDKDYLIAADGLRVQARRAANLAQTLLVLPGSAAIRSQKDSASLSDVTFALADILRNQIEPAIYLIIDRGLTSDPRTMTQYLRGHLVDLQNERDATRSRIQALRDALQGYMASGSRQREATPGSPGVQTQQQQGLDTQTLIPQINDTFLDRLISMSTATQERDVEYRQRLTERIIKEDESLFDLNQMTAYYDGLVKLARSTGGPDPVTGAAVRAQLRSAYDALVVTVNKLMTLYEEVSAQRLNPAAVLYAVQDPFTVRTQYALTWGTAVLVLSVCFMAALVGAPIACAMHQARTRRKAAAHAR